MRQLTEHQINECNQAITIEAGELAKDGASHEYRMSYPIAGLMPRQDSCDQILKFQNGPIKEVGTNGITHEALIAILLDRLRHYEAGPWACQENADAIAGLELAQTALHSRTKARVARGVEGTHTV